MGRAIIFLHKICSMVLFKKKTLAKEFFCEFCKIFKNSFFTENLWMTASILLQLLTLCFAIIHSWQLSSSEKSLFEKKKMSIYLKDFTDLEILISTFYFFIVFYFYFILLYSFIYLFILTNSCLSCQLRKAYPVLWAANRFVGQSFCRFVESPKHDNSAQFWKSKFRFEHFRRNTRFLSSDGFLV